LTVLSGHLSGPPLLELAVFRQFGNLRRREKFRKADFGSEEFGRHFV